jgi:hypothetical protein
MSRQDRLESKVVSGSQTPEPAKEPAEETAKETAKVGFA